MHLNISIFEESWHLCQFLFYGMTRLWDLHLVPFNCLHFATQRHTVLIEGDDNENPSVQDFLTTTHVECIRLRSMFLQIKSFQSLITWS